MSAEHFTCPRCGETTSLIKCDDRMPYGYACRPCYAEMRDENERKDDKAARLRKVKIFPPTP